MIAMKARRDSFEPNGELGAKWSVAPDCATLAPRALGSAANAISHMKPHSAARTLAGGYSSHAACCGRVLPVARNLRDCLRI
jgi:hypothetical protein